MPISASTETKEGFRKAAAKSEKEGNWITSFCMCTFCGAHIEGFLGVIWKTYWAQSLCYIAFIILDDLKQHTTAEVIFGCWIHLTETALLWYCMWIFLSTRRRLLGIIRNVLLSSNVVQHWVVFILNDLKQLTTMEVMYRCWIHLELLK